MHGARNLQPRDYTVIDGIPVTSLPRTLLDCAPILGHQQLRFAEVDSYGFRKTRARFESDRRKDTRFQLAGLRVIRPTQHRMEREGAQLIADTRALLEHGSLAASPRRPGAARGG